MNFTKQKPVNGHLRSVVDLSGHSLISTREGEVESGRTGDTIPDFDRAWASSRLINFGAGRIIKDRGRGGLFTKQDRLLTSLCFDTVREAKNERNTGVELFVLKFLAEQKVAVNDDELGNDRLHSGFSEGGQTRFDVARTEEIRSPNDG